MLTDPIADMLTRLRNASMVGHSHVTLSHSKIKKSVLEIMKEKGFVVAVKENNDGKFKEIIVDLDPKRELNIRRMSKPGHRNYKAKADLHSVREGLGIGIISTSKGIMTTNDAKNQGVGGELICEIY